MSFATVLCLIPENVYGRPVKITGNGLAASANYLTVNLRIFLNRTGVECRGVASCKRLIVFIMVHTSQTLY